MKKIINKYKIIVLSIVIAISVYSCEKEIDVKLRSVPSHIVIEGIVKQDQLAKVRVSHTLDFNDNSGYPFLKGVIVKISDDAGNSEILQQDKAGWYVAQNIKGVVGRTYNLSVNYDSKEYTATSYIPPFVKLDSLSMYKVPIMKYAFPMIHFQDPKGSENQYYRCDIFINGNKYLDMSELALSTEFVSGSPVHQFLPVTTHNDDIDPIQKGDSILVEFQCIDEGVHKFFKALGDINQSNNNPTSNIRGGALGYFMACTVDTMKIKADWED